MYAEKQKIYADLVALSPSGKTLAAHIRKDEVIKIYKFFNKGFELYKTISTSHIFYIDNIAINDLTIAAINSLRSELHVYKKKDNQWDLVNIPSVRLDVDFTITIGEKKIFIVVQHTRRDKTSGTIYVFNERDNRWIYEEDLSVIDGEATGRFGDAISFNNDTLVVGDWEGGDYKGLVSDYKGLVYIFKYVNNTWIQEAKIKSPDGVDNEYFGHSVNINSKGNVIVVGAIGGRNNSNIRSGCVYVFTRDNDTWKYRAKLTASDGKASDGFGSSIAVNDDGSIILIGARYDNSKGVCAGSAYIFAFDGNTWIEQEKIVAEDVKNRDYFGSQTFVSRNNTFIIKTGGWENNLAYVFNS